MKNSRLLRVGQAWLAIAALIFAQGGCDDEDGATTQNPSQGQSAAAQQSSAAASVVGETVKIVSAELVDEALGANAPLTSGRSSRAPSTSGFNFQNSVSLTIDLDAKNSSGVDLFPNATGTLGVSATGSSTSSGTGTFSASYAVTVTYQTDVTFTDPESGVKATVKSGTTLDYTSDISLTITNLVLYSWSLTSVGTAKTTTSFSVTVTDGTDTFNATVDADLKVTLTLTGIGNIPTSLSVDLSGFWQATVTNASTSESHTVRFDITSLQSIMVTIDGASFGPYTAAQLKSIFGVTVG